jgi:hypothetical protein
VPDEGTVSNGGLGEEHLCPVGGGHLLRPDAAAAYLALSESYEEARGSAPCLTDSYRSLATQQDLAARKPGLAARPGTSEHGWGSPSTSAAASRWRRPPPTTGCSSTVMRTDG